MTNAMGSMVAQQQPGMVAFIGMMARLTIAQATRQVWIVLRDMAVTEMLKQRPMSADTLPQLEGDGRARAGAGLFIFFLWVTTCHPSRSHREGGARRATSMKDERG
jgi:hypothetical protein